MPQKMFYIKDKAKINLRCYGNSPSFTMWSQHEVLHDCIMKCSVENLLYLIQSHIYW